MFIVRAASFHVKRRLIVLWALLRSLGDHMESTVNICSSCINTGIRNMGEEVFRCSDRNPVCVCVCVCVCVYLCICMCVQSLSFVWLCVTLCTVAHRAPLSMGFSRQEHWNGLPCPPPRDLPHSGIDPLSLFYH